MPFPKFSPLQSRFAASLIASVILLMLYFTFSSNHFAYAADVESVPPEDHNHDRLFEMEMDMLSASTADPESRDDGGYEAAFLGYDRGIIGKAPILDLPTQLTNNVPQANNLEQGQTNFYLFPSSALGLRARSIEDGEADVMEERDEELYPADLDRRLLQRDTTSRLVYISVNVCLQPNPIQSTTVNPPPQLQLYISQTESNPNPGPDSDGAQETFTLEGGATNQTVNATGDIYMGLYGQNTTAYNGVWSTQIAASTDAFYHSILSGSGSNLGLVDSDSSSALLITGNLTNENASSPAFQAVMDAAPPYVLFVSNISDQYIQGVQNSYCGLQQNAQFAPSVTGQSASNVQASLTTRGIGVPRQQFYLTGINNGTTYTAALAKYGGGNSTSNSSGVIGGGGTVWPMMNFTTLSGMSPLVLFMQRGADNLRWQLRSDLQSVVLRSDGIRCTIKPR
jgi:calcium channel MID1